MVGLASIVIYTMAPSTGERTGYLMVGLVAVLASALVTYSNLTLSCGS